MPTQPVGLVPGPINERNTMRITLPTSDWRLLTPAGDIAAEVHAHFGMGIALAETAGALADRAERAARGEQAPLGGTSTHDIVLECARQLLCLEPSTVDSCRENAQEECAALRGAAYETHFVEVVRAGLSALLAITPWGQAEDLERKVRLLGAIQALAVVADFSRVNAQISARLEAVA